MSAFRIVNSGAFRQPRVVSHFSPSVAAKVAAWAREERPAGLTEREREVPVLVAVGHSNKQIAREMGISEKTVEYHVTNIFGKLGVGSRSETIVWVKNSGLSVGQSDPRDIPR